MQPTKQELFSSTRKQEDHLALFRTTTCGDLIKNQKLVAIDSQDTVQHAIDSLAKSGITSAPVFDKMNNQYSRILDLSALIAVGINLVKEGKKSHIIVDNSSKLEEMLNTINIQIIPKNFPEDLSEQHPFHTLLDTEPLLAALQMLSSTGKKRVVHRAAVVDKMGDVRALLSQADLVRYVMSQMDHLPKIKEVLNHTISQLQLVNSTKKAFVLNQNKLLIDALSIMHEKGISGIGLVDDHEKLVGVVSFSQVKSLLANKLYSSLMKSCGDFYQHFVASGGDEEEKVENKLYMAVYPDTTLQTVLRRIRSKHLHHVFVVHDGKPAGVISLTDILRLFLTLLSD